MREIVTLQIGQCGNQIGTKFWELISCEHGINEQGYFCGESAHQLERIEVYYTEERKERYVPRAVLLDLEPGVLDSIRGRQYGRLFRPDNFISGNSGAGNNWAKGHYGEGFQLAHHIMHTLRKEIEDADCLQGVQILHSLGGGTGSGLGTLLISKLREEYLDIIISTHSIIPSPKISDIVVEPFNCVLSVHNLIEYSDETFVMDNEALYNICSETCKIKQPIYSDINHLVCNTISGVTACFRFPGQLNSDLRKLAVNMIPFPRMHFLVPSFAPIFPKSEINFHSNSTSNIIRQLCEMKNMMADVDPRDGRYFTMATLFRGYVSTTQVEKQMDQIHRKNGMYFMDWIPSNMQTAICDIPAYGYDKSATLICNTTAIQQMFNRLLSQYRLMYRRRAFLHWYLYEGMEMDEFTFAEENLSFLNDEYQVYQNLTADKEDEYEDDE